VRRALAVVALAASVARPARADLPKALADFKAGRYMEATAELQTILDRSPGDAYAYFLLGHCLLRMQRPGKRKRSSGARSRWSRGRSISRDSPWR
jgi:Flp pilus assembly protein TadD